MKQALLIGKGLYRNEIFDLRDIKNRDNCFKPYVDLREEFYRHGIVLNTVDCATELDISFELHVNCMPRLSAAPAYLLLLETGLVEPDNSKFDRTAYDGVFTWDEGQAILDRFYKINFPNSKPKLKYNDFNSRDLFMCLISGNKCLPRDSINDLYSERVRAIRWFEKNQPESFELYGVGWNSPAARPNVLNKIYRRLYLRVGPILGIKAFKSYRGEIRSKADVLSRAKFSICFENVGGINGYLTEKIFDCFFYGNVPVYLGAPDVSKYIPSECFIDMRKFSNYSDLYLTLREMDEKAYQNYQNNIAEFLNSGDFYPFSSESFSQTVCQTIIRDLNRVP